MKFKLLSASTLLAVSLLAVPVATTVQAAETNDTAVTTEEKTKPEKGVHRHGKGKEAEEPATAIGKDTAKAAALADAGLTSEQVEKVKARYTTKNETSAYHVFFKYENTVYSYKIDAETGSILNKETGTADELKDKVKGKRDGKGGKAGKKGERTSEKSGPSENTESGESTVAS